MSRAKEARAARRASQFAKFRLTQLNLIPLVDTFVSIVFFALTTSVVGELAPIIPGVNLPSASVGSVAHKQLTVGIAKQMTLDGHPLLNTSEAASTRSNMPGQPLLIPQLFKALKSNADSIRKATGVAADKSLDIPLAIQADRTMRYDLLARVLQTARLAGFRNLSLQINHSSPAPASVTASGT
ncbi:MAG: ExbD/TolR family protein [Gemmatimonadaceae bacterium]